MQTSIMMQGDEAVVFGVVVGVFYLSARLNVSALFDGEPWF